MIRKFIFALAALSLLSNEVFTQQIPKLSLDPQKSEWFRDAKFGMFIHWGLYSMLEGSYNGRTLPDESLPNGKSWYAEWIQMRLEVPSDEYKALAKQFNPINFNADAWIAEAKNAGMRYFVITAKHHDGFALWDTKVSDFKVTNSPFRRDVLAELVAACKKHGIKYGFYYSHWQDWEYPGGAMPEWYPFEEDAKFEKYWQEKSLPQVKELLKMFDPDLLWFDTWNWETHITDKRRDELIALVRANSSKCLINGRISFNSPGDNIDFLEMHDNKYPDKILDKPWQTPATMVHSWGWHASDFNWKSSPKMIEYLINNASKGGNYLLNIGPKPDGTIPMPAVRRLREIGAWLYCNGDAVYSTTPVKIEVPANVYLTQKNIANDHILYVSFTKHIPELIIPIDSDEIISSYILETGMPVKFHKEGGRTKFIIPLTIFTDQSAQVVVVKLRRQLL